MNRELARKRPATVVNSSIVPAGPAIIRAGSAQALRTSLARLERRGRIADPFILRPHPVHGHRAQVTLLPPRSWWARNQTRVITLLALGIPALGALGFVLMMLVSALLAFLPYALGILVLMLAIVFGRSGVTIIQNATVNK